MRSVRSLVAVGLALGGMLLAAGPAQAARPTVQFLAPTAGQRLTVSTFPVHVDVNAPGSGTLQGDVTVAIKTTTGQPASNITKAAGGQRTLAVRETVTLAVNGAYRADVTATGRDGVIDPTPETTTTGIDFLVDVAPAPPADVAVAVDGDRHVTVSWKANTEPDLVGYEVQRRVDGGDWGQLVVTAQTTAVDESSDEAGGAYDYRVVAFRRSADPDTALPSEPSSVRTANVPAPPTPTTLGDGGGGRQEEGSGGAGSGAGSGGRTGTSSGSSGSGSRSGSSGSSRKPTLESSGGRVDLSGFSALVAKSGKPGSSTGGAAREDDGTYDERLPFKARSRGEGGDDGDVVIGEEVGDDGTDRVRSLAFLAGGLLATVLLMHVLWVRSEIRRADHLDALVPDGLVPEPSPAPSRFDAWARFRARRAPAHDALPVDHEDLPVG